MALASARAKTTRRRHRWTSFRTDCCFSANNAETLSFQYLSRWWQQKEPPVMTPLSRPSSGGAVTCAP